MAECYVQNYRASGFIAEVSLRGHGTVSVYAAHYIVLVSVVCIIVPKMYDGPLSFQLFCAIQTEIYSGYELGDVLTEV